MDKIKNIVKIMFLFFRQLNVNLDMTLISKYSEKLFGVIFLAVICMLLVLNKANFTKYT